MNRGVLAKSFFLELKATIIRMSGEIDLKRLNHAEF